MPRPRKSLEDHVRDGTYRKDRHGPLPVELGGKPEKAKVPDRVPKVAAPAPAPGQVPRPPVAPVAPPAMVVTEEPLAEQLEMPNSLSGPAAAVWDEMTGLLGGLIRRRDIPALVELCRWVARSEAISLDLDAMEPTEPGYRGLLVSAAIATDKIAKLTSVFGLTPADRQKLRPVSPGGPVKPKVATRPATNLDRKGAPK